MVLFLANTHKYHPDFVFSMVSANELPYAYNALEPHIDEQTMKLHHGKHYAGYVAKYNAAVEGTAFADLELDEVLANLDGVPEDMRGAVRNNGGGASNHAKFWEWMTPESTSPEGALLDAIQATFDGFEGFQSAFKQAALSQFGSGWAWLVVDGEELRIMSTANQDSPISQGLTPILGLDVWEHAYYKHYGPGRADYIDAWWNVVNWDKVAELYEQATN